MSNTWEQFIEGAKQINDRYLTIRYKAMELGVIAHQGQVYGNKKIPYIAHLSMADDVLRALYVSFSGWMEVIDCWNIMGFDFRDEKVRERAYALLEMMLQVRAAIWLHDAPEDNKAITFDQIQDIAGPEVCRIVYRVTDEPAKNRSEKWELTAPKIRGDMCSIIIKLADRLANTLNSIQDKSTHFSMYKKEHAKFRELLFLDFDKRHPLAEQAERMMYYLDEMFESGDIPQKLAEKMRL